MMETRIDGINEFAKETVSNLLKKYPDIDFYDLMFQFEMQFRHEYSKAMLKETLINVVTGLNSIGAIQEKP